MSNLNKVITLNLALLITHQIDSAYWHEWTMFGLPGGIQFFNVLNFILFILVLRLYIAVIRLEQFAFIASIIFSGISMLVFFIHIGFYLFGFEQFNLPVSVLIIILCLLSSILQIFITISVRQELMT